MTIRILKEEDMDKVFERLISARNRIARCKTQVYSNEAKKKAEIEAEAMKKVSCELARYIKVIDL